MSHIIWNHNEVNIDETFVYNIAMNVMWQWGSRTNDHWWLSTKKWLAKMKRCNISIIIFAC